ncbi:MAG: hypothetical protein WCO13_05640 [Bacteroidota bacterium]
MEKQKTVLIAIEILKSIEKSKRNILKAEINGFYEENKALNDYDFTVKFNNEVMPMLNILSNKNTALYMKNVSGILTFMLVMFIIGAIFTLFGSIGR